MGLGMRFSLLDGAWVDVAALHLSSFTCVTYFTPSFLPCDASAERGDATVSRLSVRPSVCDDQVS